MNLTFSSVDLHKRLGKSHSYVAGVIEGLVVSGRLVSPQDFEARGSFKGASERAFSRKYFLSESACRLVTAAIKGAPVPAPSIKKDVQPGKIKATAKRRKPMNLPTIAGIEITTDSEGRFNLNALHRASSTGDHKRPSKWLASEPTQDLIRELEAQSPLAGFGDKSTTCINTVKGGNAPGTFAAEQLAVAYANWISPSFYLQVINTFLAYKKGAIVPSPASMSRLEILQLAIESEEGRLIAEQGRTEALAVIEAQKPMVEFHNSVAAATNSVLLGDFCKMLPNAGITMGRNNTFAWLRSEKILDYKNLPYQQYMDRGWFTVEEKTYENDNSNGPRTVFTTKVTGKGQIGLVRKLKETDSYERFLNKQAVKNATGRDLDNNA
jgi:phage antirepressor YoqD-like protein